MTSPGLPSYSYSGPYSTAKEALIPPTICSGSGFVQFFIEHQPYNSATSTNDILEQVDLVSLLFTTQKNGFKGESIGHGRTGHPQVCPVADMHRRVAYLRYNGATGATPISSFKKGYNWQQICGDEITAYIRDVVRAAGPEIGFTNGFANVKG